MRSPLCVILIASCSLGIPKATVLAAVENLLLRWKHLDNHRSPPWSQADPLGSDKGFWGYPS